MLDTNVLMHDPTSLFRFEEHDVYLPMMTLEELDDHKKGMSEVARNARQVSRFLDELIAGVDDGDIDDGIPLAKLGNSGCRRAACSSRPRLSDGDLPAGLPAGKADNQILGVVHAPAASSTPKRDVVLVSKDINMRIKARALGLAGRGLLQRQGARGHRPALHRRRASCRPTSGTSTARTWSPGSRAATPTTACSGPLVPTLHVNQFVYLDEPGERRCTRRSRRSAARRAVLRDAARTTRTTKNAVWGITARNREQNFALNLLMNPEIDFVTLLGQAGTGKTLLALAAGLTQTLDEQALLARSS